MEKAIEKLINLMNSIDSDKIIPLSALFITGFSLYVVLEAIKALSTRGGKDG